MANIEIKSFDSPDETRPFEGNGQAEVVQVAGQTIGKGTFEPGWRWSENVKPIAGKPRSVPSRGPGGRGVEPPPGWRRWAGSRTGRSSSHHHRPPVRRTAR